MKLVVVAHTLYFPEYVPLKAPSALLPSTVLLTRERIEPPAPAPMPVTLRTIAVRVTRVIDGGRRRKRRCRRRRCRVSSSG